MRKVDNGCERYDNESRTRLYTPRPPELNENPSLCIRELNSTNMYETHTCVFLQHDCLHKIFSTDLRFFDSAITLPQVHPVVSYLPLSCLVPSSSCAHFCPVSKSSIPTASWIKLVMVAPMSVHSSPRNPELHRCGDQPAKFHAPQELRRARVARSTRGGWSYQSD